MLAINWKEPNYLPFVQDRNDRLEQLRSDPVLMQAAKQHYAENPWDFINDWAYTYDPRRKPAVMPFILFPRQVEYLQWLMDRLNNKEDGLADKCRDVGFTWLNVGFATTMWLFHDDISIGFGSRKEMLVDRLGDMDSIFEKIRMFLRFIPPEFLPYGTGRGESVDRGYDESRDALFLRIINIENKSTITGEAGDNIGRGGRKTMYFKDESAFYERPEKIEAALSQNSDVKIDCSTANGTDNIFYEKRMSGKIPVFTFNWFDDPRKDQAWFDREEEKSISSSIFASEVLIDYFASKPGKLLKSEWVNAAAAIEIEPSGVKRAGLDVADEEGEDTNALCTAHGVVVNDIEEWNGLDTTVTARKAKTLCDMFGVETLNYDCIGVGAGVRGEMNSLGKEAGLNFEVYPYNAGGKVQDPSLKQFGDAKNDDLFSNVKAQEWWKLRERFEKTYKHFKGEKTYPLDELISIPNNPQLISELSQIQWSTNGAGKILIDKKPKGSKSPNLADSVKICFAKSQKGRERRVVVI